MKTFINQPTNDEFLVLPFISAQETIERMKKNPHCIIHKITTFIDNGQVKQKIKYHYEKRVIL